MSQNLDPRLERLLSLWFDPLPEHGAEDLFRTVYTDPVTVNGNVLTAADLVARARAVQAALADVERTVLDWSVTADKWSLAFEMSGRHVGPMATQLGVVAPTGQTVRLRVIDVLTVVDGLITSIWMVPDEAGFLASTKSAALVDGAVAR